MSTSRPSIRRPQRRPPPPPEGWVETLVARFVAPIDALTAAIYSILIVLFILGYRWGVYTGANRWKTGLLLPLFGLILMGIAIPLGG